jgi:hypothetical protein
MFEGRDGSSLLLCSMLLSSAKPSPVSLHRAAPMLATTCKAKAQLLDKTPLKHAFRKEQNQIYTYKIKTITA